MLTNGIGYWCWVYCVDDDVFNYSLYVYMSTITEPLTPGQIVVVRHNLSHTHIHQNAPALIDLMLLFGFRYETLRCPTVQYTI